LSNFIIALLSVILGHTPDHKPNNISQDKKDLIRSLLQDLDGDGWLVSADCDDNDPILNGDDVDGDGLTTCEGDADDTNPLVLACLPEFTFTLVTPSEVQHVAGEELVVEFNLTANACADLELVDFLDLFVVDNFALGWTQGVLLPADLENLSTGEVYEKPVRSAYSIDMIEHDYEGLDTYIDEGDTHTFRLTFPSTVAAPSGYDYEIQFGSIILEDQDFGAVLDQDLTDRVYVHVI
jgi:hypothetical protein